MFTTIRIFIGSLFLTAFSLNTFSESIPDDLAEWKDWVSHKQEFYQCPYLSGQDYSKKSNHLCAWPSELRLVVTKTQAKFSQKWTLLNKSMIPLPGNSLHWPQSVLVNNKQSVVLNINNKPFVQLGKGDYSISGLIPWNKRPENIEIPDQVAMIELTVNNKKVDFIKRKNNQVWLGSTKRIERPKANVVKLRVNRLINDGHPMTMTMILDIDIGGSAREEVLTQIDREKYQLKSISSQLNTQIDNQGNLKVQLRPGSYEIKLAFKVHGFPNEFNFEENGKHWPKQEIWIYKNNERLRSTQIVSGVAIDSEQGIVNSWRSLPHYVVNQNESLNIKEGHRGISHSSDRLSLNRKMWLSFDNNHYYFFDTIKGSKSKDWRVNTFADYKLTQLKNHNKNRLITYTTNSQGQPVTGVEVRTPNINIYAGGEVSADKMKHASGWDINFATTKVNLTIPPGRKLIAISGADSSSGDWISQWNLIDLFLVLIISAMTFKFLGLPASIFALITLTIGYHESYMPTFLWLNLIAAISIAGKVTSPNWLKGFNIYKWVSVALLLLNLLPFIAQQIRFTLHPQLEISRSISSNEYDSSTAMRFSAPQKPSVRAEVAQEMKTEDSFSLKRKMVRANANEVMVTGSRIQRSDLDNSYYQGTVIQAGKGQPNWRWSQVHYEWNGPVAGNEPVALHILTTNWVRLLRIIMIISSVLWLLTILNKGFNIKNRLKKLLNKPSKTHSNNMASLGLAILMGVSSLTVSESLEAKDYPSDKLLNELHQRLFPKPDCIPNCVSINEAKLTVNEQAITIELSYQSGAEAAALLPQSNDWEIQAISINGQPTQSIWKNKSGQWLSLKPGISTVKLIAKLKVKSDLMINFPEKPVTITHQIKGWDLTGVNRQKLSGNSIQLTRKEPVKVISGNDESKSQPNPILEQSIGELFLLTKKFHFGTQWTLTNVVSRQAPQKGTITTEIPLLSFEHPIQKTNNIKNRKMNLVLPNNTYSTSWESIIKTEDSDSTNSKSFELTAMDKQSVSETWEILVFPNWNIQFNGIPAVTPSAYSANDYWVYQYYPRAGEKLSFTLSRPPASLGESVAVSQVQQDYSISKRKTSNQIQIDYHATRAEPLVVKIGDYELKEVKQDGAKINLAKVNDQVSINLKPGMHSITMLVESTKSINFEHSLGPIAIGKDFSNLTNRVTVPDSRWLVMASGAGYGPAILYWGELIFFALLAVGLSRLKFSPLSYWQWLILGLGMSTFSWPALALVSLWLLASQWKRDNKEVIEKYSILSNWLTVISSVIAVLALVAAVPFGLLQSPDMGISGNGSYGNYLVWFLDQGNDSFGEIVLYTLPLWVYKVLMLIWATWLSFSLIKWLSWVLKDLTGAKFKKGDAAIKQ